MPQIVSIGGELVRINPSNNHIERSTNGGRSWMTRYTGSYCGEFLDLLEFDGRLLACTDKGIYCSSNNGASWMAKCTSSVARSLTSLQDGGGELIGMSEDGHIYASSTGGASWLRRR